MAPEEEINKLKAELERHNKLYHQDDNPEISDAEYDALYQRFKDLEAKQNKKEKLSPTDKVGAKPVRNFEKHDHIKPMLSLNNVFNEEEFEKFEERVLKRVGNQEIIYSIEPKFDGIGVSLTYEKGRLSKAVPRGDGITGEVITENVKTIKHIPLTLEDYPEVIEIRGEVFFRLKHFKNINEEIESKNGKKFLSPRNAAAGTLRNLDIEVVASRPLDVFFYGLGGHSSDFTKRNQRDFLNFLKENNFSTNEFTNFSNKSGVKDHVDKILSSREGLDYEIDGAVVKVDDFSKQEKLGFVSKAPRWAVAWKFPATEKVSKVKKVLFSVGRTGVITPFATIEPVLIAGANISNISLHNMDELKRLEIMDNDSVLVRRAGDVIPQLVKVNKELRSGDETPVKIPDKCPSCESELFLDGPFLKCGAGMKCKKQLFGFFEHFVSRKAMNIEGLGYKINKTLINLGYMKSAADLFRLKKYESELKSLEGFGEKSIENLFQSIESSREPSLAMFIYSLGIPEVGETTASSLARYFKTFSNFKNTNLDELLQMDNIGDIVAQKIINFLSTDPIGIDDLVNELSIKDFIVTEDSHLDNKKIVITGTFEEYSREELKDIIKDKGGIPSSSVSSKTNYLICGENPGSKLRKAEEFGIELVKEENLKEFLKI